MDYDKKEALLNSAFIGFWKKGKENNDQIRLINFNPRSKRHLCVLKIAETVSNFYNYDLIVKVGKIRGWFIKIFYKMKFISRPKLVKGVDVEEFASLVELAVEADQTVFAEALKEYYGRRVK